MVAPRSPALKRFSRDEFYRLGELGFLTERFELLDGEIYQMPPIGPEHAVVTTVLHRVVGEQVPTGFHVRDGLPLDLGDSQPQPDLAIIVGDPADYRLAHPSTAVWVVEVADSSPEHDLRLKASNYARAGIADYWVVDLVARRVIIHRAPSGPGYGEVRVFSRESTVCPSALPMVEVKLSELL